jgi:hypothetical protein
MQSIKKIVGWKKSSLIIIIVCFFVLFSSNAYSADTLEADFSISLDADYQDGSYFSVYKDSTYVYVASYYTGLQLYGFDGNKFTFLDNHYTGGNENFYFDVTGDDEFVYVACYGDGLKVYSVYENKLVLRDSIDNDGYYYGVASDDSYIYTACYEEGIKAYTFDGKDKLSLTSSIDFGGRVLDIYTDGDYIYSCGNDGLKVLSFNGTSFSLIDHIKQPNSEADWYWDVCSDGTNIYVACDYGGIKVYSFDGDTLTYITEKNSGKRYLSVDCSNSFVFAGSAEADGSIEEYYFTGDKLNLIDNTSERQTCNGLFYDGSYLFAACQNQGLKVFEVEEKTIPDDTEYLFDVKVTLSEGNFKEGKNIESLVELLKAEGDGVANGTLTYTIFDENNKIVFTDIDPSSTLLQSTDTKLIPTGSLDPGKYTLNILLEYGDNQNASASKEFEIEKDSNTQVLFSNLTVVLIALSACLLFILLFSHKKKISKMLKTKK